jgi:hypothetical protein
MKKRGIGILSFLIALALFTNAYATTVVVNFDDLSNQSTFAAPPSNYGGINWEGSDWGTWTWSGGYYQWHSPSTALLTNSTSSGYGYTVDYFSFNNPAEFEGAWFSGSGNLEWQLYYQGNLVSTVANMTNTPNISTFYATNYSGLIDRVGLLNDRGSVIMDDVTYNTNASPVPEPATMLLLGLGLMGLAGVRRKFKK